MTNTLLRFVCLPPTLISPSLTISRPPSSLISPFGLSPLSLRSSSIGHKDKQSSSQTKQRHLRLSDVDSSSLSPIKDGRKGKRERLEGEVRGERGQPITKDGEIDIGGRETNPRKVFVTFQALD